MTISAAVNDYNKFLDGVELSDQWIQSYSARTKTYKWYKTFFHFLDIAVVNSSLLFRGQQDKRHKGPRHLQYWMKTHHRTAWYHGIQMSAWSSADQSHPINNRGGGSATKNATWECGT
ncbi:hypothetical protein ANANG_G00157480 [Anguilla anguilla]|uniref:PiggyBac transposable element-derived protein domain-containing protein n=1 Tax=Anguilla anguilla TaxID=7936 RepID=A0A9D3RV09_ANGAN|nr:hypothetical protein ANANG_G00157480 [Anguilla anguilla]